MAPAIVNPARGRRAFIADSWDDTKAQTTLGRALPRKPARKRMLTSMAGA
jgi:hypothetical protein